MWRANGLQEVKRRGKGVKMGIKENVFTSQEAYKMLALSSMSPEESDEHLLFSTHLIYLSSEEENEIKMRKTV